MSRCQFRAGELWGLGPIGVGPVTLTPSDDDNKTITIHSFCSHIRFPALPSLYDHDFLSPCTSIMKNRNKTTKFPVVRFPVVLIDLLCLTEWTPFYSLSKARIKKIMQKDEEVGKVAQATPIVICMSCAPSPSSSLKSV